MKKLDFLKFETLTVIKTGENSNKYLFKKIKGNRIDKNTTIIVDMFEFDVDYIIDDDVDGDNCYRLVNSNETIVVELK